MARFPGAEAVYAEAEQFRERCLLGGSPCCGPTCLTSPNTSWAKRTYLSSISPLYVTD